MSAEAFGHTGFTGTSIWIDPVRDVYIVLLTAKGQEFDRQRGQEVGADLYMTKPFEFFQQNSYFEKCNRHGFHFLRWSTI